MKYYLKKNKVMNAQKFNNILSQSNKVLSKHIMRFAKVVLENVPKQHKIYYTKYS